MGSIHYEFNDSCEPPVFIATLSDEDPGLSRMAQNFFGLRPTLILDIRRFLIRLTAQFDVRFPAAFAWE